ncbi:uncharacterized protein LOC111643723, partial [Copidosoma floridanum]|uniref:uncharacterized protein LOC111643723 n=1 Tax=Copidosoma floridanum TaxID=29053 RepID=UPI000C6F624C
VTVQPRRASILLIPVTSSKHFRGFFTSARQVKRIKSSLKDTTTNRMTAMLKTVLFLGLAMVVAAQEVERRWPVGAECAKQSDCPPGSCCTIDNRWFVSDI